MDGGKQQDGRPAGGGTAPAGGEPVIEDERPWELPDYLHDRELGAGASGRVVLARHRETGTPVAIKYLHGSVGTPALRAEAQVLATIDSPHVTRLYEYVEGERGSAIVMELVDGIALRDLLRAEGATTPEAALVVLKGSLLGLAAAHDAGVVHRDYKPANVLVDTLGISKLVDFGIAVPSGDDRDVSGTPAYMPPEQWAGRPASPAGDVYAATVTFFECLTGARPYGGTTIAELAVQHTEAPIPAELAPDPVRPLILAGLAKDPQARPGSAAALVEELEAVAAAGYGREWEEKGRLDLTALVALLALLLPGSGGAAGGTSLAHTALGGADASTGPQAAAGADTAPAAAVRETLVRRGARPGSRGKALVGVVAGTLTLATLAGMAMAGAADGGARTVVGGAVPEATTTLGAPDPTGGASPAPGGAADTPNAEPSTPTAPPSTPSGSPSGSPTASSSATAAPTGRTPTAPGKPPAGGGPTTGLPPAPPGGGPATVAPSAPPAGPTATTAVPTLTIAPVTPTLTIAPATLTVSSVNLDSLTCSGRWSLTSTVTVVAQGTGTGTLTLNWYHTSGGRPVTVGTDTVVVRDGRATVTRPHDFGSADTFPTWGVSVGTTPAAAKPGKTSATMAAYLCDPPR